MPRYLISFNYGDMNVPDDELPAVGEAARAVVRQASEAGVLVFAGGVGEPQDTRVVAPNGQVRVGPRSQRAEFIGGLTIVEVAGPAEALAWGAKIAAACRCDQEVREFMPGAQVCGE
ncbi:YciI family protein [Ideonella sp. DXS29W]|uniref:YciI family protein n=1 Tax=Ideonella lacteola TaxID=2984193 RepID=A0ABU9BM51_9BURK